MALRTIITKGDPVLNKKAHLVTNFDEKLAILLDDMVETLRDSGGVGLAAPQVTYVVQALRKEGIPIDDGLITVEEARDAILRMVGMENGKDGKTGC